MELGKRGLRQRGRSLIAGSENGKGLESTGQQFVLHYNTAITWLWV